MIDRVLLTFRVPELRQKIILTVVLLAVYRMGFWIPLPFVDQAAMQEQIAKMQQGDDSGVGQFMQIIALFSASHVGNATIFGLGIMPYISASIIFQLLSQVYPPLEALQKEGEAGRRKINEYTRYATVIICLGQSYFWLLNSGNMLGGNIFLEQFDTWYWRIVGALIMTSGTIVLMWIGEQIDAYGIGNGISLLIMAGIVARMPYGAARLFEPALREGVRIGSPSGLERYLILAVVFVTVVVWIVCITQGQRRIPIQSAKHARGMQHAAARRFLPLRVNQAGVMPIIFASSLLMFPFFLFQQLSQASTARVWDLLRDAFGGGRGYIYTVSYVGLIYFFAFFWTAISFNPKQISENLKDYGSFIPGYRPGKRTEDYLESVMLRITFVGAAFLSVIAIVPTMVAAALSVDPLIASFYGGTGLLIVVSVALDLVQKIDSHLVTRNYSGLLES